jgi:hypothetical protein
VKLSRAEFDARGRAREGCHAQWICHARAEPLKRPSGEVAAGPSQPPLLAALDRTPSMTGTNWRRARWGHSRPPTPPPRARSVTQGVVENGYALSCPKSCRAARPGGAERKVTVMTVKSPRPRANSPRANVEKSWHVFDHRRPFGRPIFSPQLSSL